jgi:hypothetical protein
MAKKSSKKSSNQVEEPEEIVSDEETENQSTDEEFDEEFEELLNDFQPRQFTNDQFVMYIIAGAIVCALPAYLFISIYNMSVEDFGLVYAVVTALGTAAMSLSYRNVATGTNARLSAGRKFVQTHAKKRDGMSTADVEKMQEEMTFRESIVWSVFYNNLVFFLLFMLFCFYCLKNVQEDVYNYSFAVTGAAGATWQLSRMLYV